MSWAVMAEYRVFTLHILNKAKTVTKQVETTLDPEQYIGFYPLRQGEEISYIETWRCWGNTNSFKAHCPNPRLNGALGANTPAQLDRSPAAVPSQSPEVKK